MSTTHPIGTLNRDLTPEEYGWLPETKPAGLRVCERPDHYSCATNDGLLVGPADDREAPGFEVPFEAVDWDDGYVPSKQQRRDERRAAREEADRNRWTPEGSHVAVFAKGAVYTDMNQLIGDQKEAGLLDTESLTPNAKLMVRTKNSTYLMDLINPKTGDMTIQGGTRWHEPTKAILNGATWGGSMLMSGKIGIDMYLEVLSGEKRYTLTPVKSVHVLEYDGEQKEAA